MRDKVVERDYLQRQERFYREASEETLMRLASGKNSCREPCHGYLQFGSVPEKGSLRAILWRRPN
ncbi:hypothetical protein D3C85_1446220 [compost metagenome]